MADYYRTGTAITSHQDMIDDILSFLISSGPGPGWVEDATYAAAANAGKLFLQSQGTINNFVYLATTTVSGESVLQGFRAPAAANGFGGGSGPLLHKMVFGAHLKLDTASYDFVQHLFADEDRCVVVLHATAKAGAAVSGQESFTEILYLGQYTPHSGTVDDPYPCMVAGNAGRMITNGSELGFFPESIVKAVGPNDEIFAKQAGVNWAPLHDNAFVPPRNSRGSEAFAYQQDIHIFAPGAEESLSLTGMLLSTKDHGLFQDVTIAAAPYFSVPSQFAVDNNASNEYSPLYLIPKGTNIP